MGISCLSRAIGEGSPWLKEKIQWRGVCPVLFGFSVEQRFQALGNVRLGLIVEQGVKVIGSLCEGHRHTTACTTGLQFGNPEPSAAMKIFLPVLLSFHAQGKGHHH